MLLINKTRNESIHFPHILSTSQPAAFVLAVIEREYAGTEEWNLEDEYEFKETPTNEV